MPFNSFTTTSPPTQAASATVLQRKLPLDYIGGETNTWDLEPHLFLWLIFNFEMLVIGPQENKKAKTINKVVSRLLDLFTAGHIEELWKESRHVKSRRPGQHKLDKADDPDKAVQDAADKDN